MKAYAITDVGQKRPVNQDYVYCSQKPVGNLPNVFIVADGMGGHKAGEMASRFTVETFVQTVEASDEKDPITLIDETIRIVNEKLIQKAKESDEYEGMGTTLVVATIIDGVLHVANVGDSRLYIINDELQQITRDHSLVEEMISLGEIDRKDARTHEQKNIITRAMGASDPVIADFFPVDIKPGDRIVMCSDGLSNMIEDNVIKQIVKKNNSIEDAAAELMQTANDNGGIDNISIIIIEPQAER